MRRAFTIIELLVVIAIIGILTAIIVPVYSRVKDSAYRSSDISNMNALRTALQLYRADQGAYPPELLGYVTLYSGTSNVVPAGQLVAGLYPTRVSSINTFKPALLEGTDASETATTTAVWPHVDAAYYGGSNTSPLQRYQPSDGNSQCAGVDCQYYSIDGYDTALVKTAPGSVPQRELRYALFWTGYGLTTGSSQDEPRQLGYSNPPDTTVVTWDSYFREYQADGSVVPGEKRDIVLFLGGSARAFDASQTFSKAWQVTP